MDPAIGEDIDITAKPLWALPVEAWLDYNATAAWYTAPYYENGIYSRSSRTHPLAYPVLPIGIWRVDRLWLSPGRMADQLREIEVDSLKLSESSDDCGKPADIERYAQWLGESLIPPPICVLERDNGDLAISDGHRRWHAARRADIQSLRAWVSPKGLRGYHPETNQPMYVALTYEIAVLEAIAQGQLVPLSIAQATLDALANGRLSLLQELYQPLLNAHVV